MGLENALIASFRLMRSRLLPIPAASTETNFSMNPSFVRPLGAGKNMTDFLTARNELLENLTGRGRGLPFILEYTRLMDEHIQNLLSRAVDGEILPADLTLVALGGYGRGELAPYSDVDILFLTRTSAEQNKFRPVIESILYPLWDQKLTVGHAVRTPEQCVSLAQSDLTILTALLDARFLDGDQMLFEEFDGRLKRFLSAKTQRQSIFQRIKASIAERHRKYGASPYLLEPNVKEGQGALRDIHAMIWIGEAYFGARNLPELENSGFLTKTRIADLVVTHEFMSDVRMHLHRLAARKTDTLTFEMQEGVCRELGYQNNGHLSAVEEFMRDYYTHVFRTKAALDYFLSRVHESLVKPGLRREPEWSQRVEKGLTIAAGQLELAGRTEIRQRPILLMRAFEVSAASNLPVSQRSIELIRTNLDLVDEAYRQDPKIATTFLKGLAAPLKSIKNLDHLDLMQDLDLLAAYLPELAAVRAQVQHDAYHVYTVDVHQMMTLREIKKMAVGWYDDEDRGFDREVSREVIKPEILALAALLHDIGKGHGQDHARRGAEMIPVIGQRLHLSPEDTDTLQFLVAQHLYMFHISLRRDLTEEKLITDCARDIGDLDRLNMLYLITAADSRATGPGVMNNWKSTLLKDLYSKVRRILTKSGLAGKDTAQRIDQMRLGTVKLLEAQGLTNDEIDTYLSQMPAYYLAVMIDSGQIANHVLVQRQLNNGRQLV
ncbi:MAG: [protein-PII] uridylyltransferase, partial [Deltaproteobacteria bacterium]|nr:[protein-PII] uridylyltransferase [Deltaproteobacteria bacterium]